MKINPFIYGMIVLVVFLGIVLGFQGAGVWSTSGKIDAAGKQIQPSLGNVNSIKGWMTIEQVSTAFGVPVEEILSMFNLPADTPPVTALKDLESDSFDLPTLRIWLQERQPSIP